MLKSQFKMLKGRWSAMKKIISKVLEIALYVIMILIAFAINAK